MSKAMHGNVMLDPSLVEGIDLAARAAGVSRSDSIAHTATQALEAMAGAVTVKPRRNTKRFGVRRTRKRA